MSGDNSKDLLQGRTIIARTIAIAVRRQPDAPVKNVISAAETDMAGHKQSRNTQGSRPRIGYTAGCSIKVNPVGLRILRFLKLDDFPDIF